MFLSTTYLSRTQQSSPQTVSGNAFQDQHTVWGVVLTYFWNKNVSLTDFQFSMSFCSIFHLFRFFKQLEFFLLILFSTSFQIFQTSNSNIILFHFPTRSNYQPLSQLTKDVAVPTPQSSLSADFVHRVQKLHDKLITEQTAMRCLLPVTCQEGSPGVEKTAMQTISSLLISADVCFLCINTLWWKIGTEKSLCLHISQWLTAGENFVLPSTKIFQQERQLGKSREHFSYHDLRSARRSAPKAEQTSEHGFAIFLASRQTIFPHAFIVNISLRYERLFPSRSLIILANNGSLCGFILAQRQAAAPWRLSSPLRANLLFASNLNIFAEIN